MTALLLASVLALTNRFGSVSVDTYGARVLSYVPAGGSEVFAMLPSGCGGVPLCWPWFQYRRAELDAESGGYACVLGENSFEY